MGDSSYLSAEAAPTDSCVLATAKEKHSLPAACVPNSNLG